MNQAHRRLGDVLREARERRDIDLARAERETKIRSRYLQALEDGDYGSLPGAVYTRGFLRNYARYLALDPEQLIQLYRRESGEPEAAPAPVVTPLVAPRRSRAFVVTPGAILGVFLTVLVGGFVAYLVYQFVTFARVPELAVTDPPRDVASYEEMEYTIRGETEPNSRISVDGLRENPEAEADDEGRFEVTVNLVPGANVITITASDPRTGRDSESQERTIYVVPEAPTETQPPAAALTVDQPAEGATVDGPVAIVVTSNAEAVTVRATPVAPPEANFSVSDASGRAVTVTPTLPTAPDPLSLTAADGAFEGSYTLAPGTWDLAVEAASGSADPLTETRRVVVTAESGRLGVRIEVREQPSYLEITADGAREGTHSGRNAAAGTNIEVTAARTIRVRAGSGGAVTLVVDGIRVGPMGALGEVVEWTVSRSE